MGVGAGDVSQTVSQWILGALLFVAFALTWVDYSSRTPDARSGTLICDNIFMKVDNYRLEGNVHSWTMAEGGDYAQTDYLCFFVEGEGGLTPMPRPQRAVPQAPQT